MQYLRSSTAISDFIGPFVDASDAYSLETGLTINNAHFGLFKDGETSYSEKDDSSGGTHASFGMYTFGLNATDTDTVGKFRVICQVTGALPVLQEYTVLPSDVYDNMFSSVDKLDVIISDIAGIEGGGGGGGDATEAKQDSIISDIVALRANGNSDWLTATGFATSTKQDLMSDTQDSIISDIAAISVTGMATEVKQDSIISDISAFRTQNTSYYSSLSGDVEDNAIQITLLGTYLDENTATLVNQASLSDTLDTIISDIAAIEAGGGTATLAKQDTIISDLLWMHTQSTSDIADISITDMATETKQDTIISDLIWQHDTVVSDLYYQLNISQVATGLVGSIYDIAVVLPNTLDIQALSDTQQVIISDIAAIESGGGGGTATLENQESIISDIAAISFGAGTATEAKQNTIISDLVTVDSIVDNINTNVSTILSGMAIQGSMDTYMMVVMNNQTTIISDIASIEVEGGGGTATLENQQTIISDLTSIISDLSSINVHDGISFSYTVTDPNGNPVDGATVYAYTDAGATNLITSAVTDAFGVANFFFRLDSGTTVYFRAVKSGYATMDIDSEVI